MKRLIASFYAILVGVSMMGVWVLSYYSRNIPELATKPFEIYFHLAAELITALLLIIAGISLSKRKKWGSQLFLLSMGMLLYTLIQGPGYFLQRHELIFVVIFAILFVVTTYFIIFSLKEFAAKEQKS